MNPSSWDVLSSTPAEVVAPSTHLATDTLGYANSFTAENGLMKR
jgi:hypothetical protein